MRSDFNPDMLVLQLVIPLQDILNVVPDDSWKLSVMLHSVR